VQTSIKQAPDSDRLLFPGAVDSKFTNDMKFLASKDIPSIPTYRVVDQDGVVQDESHAPDVSQETATKMYKDMVSTSVMDTVMLDAQRQGRISFYMVGAGEEGSAVGSAAALRDDDVIFCQYREHAALLHKGFTLDEFMSQLYANEKDYGKGRSMPVHYLSTRLNLHPISSPLGTQLPHAVGAAYGLKLEGGDRMVIVYFGEGAASEGDFHAALNIAATKNCPILFFCRNNGYAISTPTIEQYKGDGIASRGLGYGIDTIRVDGNDVWAVYSATKAAREIVTKQQKPVLIEAMSYRVSHHSTSDDSFAYRKKTEVEDWKRMDNPLTRMRKWLENKGWWSEAHETEFRTSIRKDVLKAFSTAEKRKKPALENLFTDMYAEETADLREQREELKAVLEKYGDKYDLGSYVGGLKGL